MDQQAAQLAAKELARSISLPSWRGSVFAWLKDDDFVLVVAADPSWRRAASIPPTFHGYEVLQEDQVIGRALA